jgi:uncharacterized protein YqeY
MRANRPDGNPGDAGPDIRTRLRRALTEALKARDQEAVPALRSALSAIGNAEAERRHLTEADVAAIVRAEAAEREAAASQYERAGHAGQAAGLRRGTRALLAALGTADDGGARQ